MIPVLRPLLPPAERLLPYLRRIDATRIYSNHGPLAGELEERLAAHLALPQGGVISASSGTAALAGAILAAAGRARAERPLALIPAYTFAATAAAVELCGYRPYLADIDAHSWILDADRVIAHPQRSRVGLVVPVAPFGRPVPQASWRALRDKTGLAVVIDGAASFAGLAAAPRHFLGEIPVAISFHATKAFATGEGGAVATGDLELARRVERALNFGVHTVRDCRSASLNGKMSEYHAAVGLAEFDGWDGKLAMLRRVADSYRRRAAAAGLGDRLHAWPQTGPSYVLFRCADRAQSAVVRESLRRHRVDFRLWYGGGLQRQSYYADRPGDELGVTESLAPCVLGLPVAPDLGEEAIERVVAALREGLDDAG